MDLDMSIHTTDIAAPAVPAIATRADTLRIAILIPCYDEAATVGNVVRNFKEALPQADIYVYDNNSKDDTAAVAKAAGAIVRTERRQGKGNVVRRMFSDIEADIYLMADGDDTYDAPSAERIIAELLEGPYDMVNGARTARSSDAYRPGHAFGNKLLTGLVRLIFGTATRDMLSGYKAFSRRYVKSFPAMSAGFEIETELVVHALELRMPVSEVETPYGERPEGSESKLRTFRDAFRILRLIGLLVKEERPLYFFAFIASVIAVGSIALGASVVVEYISTGLVPRLPTAVLATGMMLTSMLCLVCGLILDTVTTGRRELKRLHYLGFRAP
ncbi:glycosyltransferase family 2 protein [Bosea sp. 124]|uniref:glycosyltransferase family 2 protein n=1 Tax=Bosea sp. 124 TaxID=2135642 RepID=UPI000D437CD7|nr:glycosyltransferase family 2 protein [Bosea sp. 124]PTM41496.1 glycosyltransferase involved in cell wall biosynthesis [Bosea sp. 124]